MDVINKNVYRVVSIDKAGDISIGDILPIPEERANFDGSHNKKETEDYFEESRKDSFAHLPSRKSVLFVLPYDRTIVNDWVASHNPHNDYDYILCTLQVTGNLIWCDEDIFTKAGIFPTFREQLAIDYWRSASDEYDQFDMSEGLFRGIAYVEAVTEEHYISPHKD